MVLKGRGRGRDRKIMKMKKVVTFSSPPIPKEQRQINIDSHSRGRKWPKFRECGWIVKTFFPKWRTMIKELVLF